MGIPFQKGRQTAPQSKHGPSNTAPSRHRKPKGKNDTLRWLIAGATAVSALSFFPSLSSALLLFIAVCAVPLPPVAQWLAARLHLAGKVKAAAMIAALFAAALAAPTDALLPAPSQDGTAPVTIETARVPADDPADAPAQSVEPDASGSAPQESSISDEAVSAPVEDSLSSDAVSQAPAGAEEAPLTQENSQKTGYVGSIGSDKYHDPDCRWAKKILPENEIWFSSKEEAQAAGYSPCGTCQ